MKAISEWRPSRKDVPMLLFMIVIAVLMGLAYADYCLVDNTEHFGICLGRAARAEQERFTRLEPEDLAAEAAAPEGLESADIEIVEPAVTPAARTAIQPARVPVTVPPANLPAVDAAWLLLEMGPVLELREEAG